MTHLAPAGCPGSPPRVAVSAALGVALREPGGVPGRLALAVDLRAGDQLVAALRCLGPGPGLVRSEAGHDGVVTVIDVVADSLVHPDYAFDRQCGCDQACYRGTAFDLA